MHSLMESLPRPHVAEAVAEAVASSCCQHSLPPQSLKGFLPLLKPLLPMPRAHIKSRRRKHCLQTFFRTGFCL